jgi:pseudaminic acid synthase
MKPFIIAEISCNHSQKKERAMELISDAWYGKADAVKIQVYKPETMTANDPTRIINHSLWGRQSLWDLYSKTYMPWEWISDLKYLADGLGIILFPTVYDLTSLEFCEKLNMPMYKISSFELLDLELIKNVAMTKKPIIISTGMGTLEEIGNAVDLAIQYTHNVTIMKCTSGYPSRYEDMNLKTIENLAGYPSHKVGFSSHSKSIIPDLIAYSFGATVFEHHLKLLEVDDTPDSAFSIYATEFIRLREALDIYDKCIGVVKYGVSPGEEENLQFRRTKEKGWKR